MKVQFSKFNLHYLAKRYSFESAVWNLDLIFLNIYFFMIFATAYFWPWPQLKDSSPLVFIPLIFLIILLAGKSLFWKFLNKTNLSTNAFSTLIPHKRTYYTLLTICSLAILATSISWTFAFHKYSDILKISPIHGMRAITTSLHLLVPLESRLMFILIPPTLMYPYNHKKKVHVIWLSLVLLIFAFATQTKLGYLFSASFLFYFLVINQKLPWKNTLFLKTTITLGLLVFACEGLNLITSDTYGTRLSSNKSIQLTAAGTAELGEIFKKSDNVCKGYDGPEFLPHQNELITILVRIPYRMFGLSSEMVRLFTCLRENGWRPNFRGHQLFRLTGGYIPYYRYAYEAFRPKAGTQINSAVTNVAADGYFNMGYFGVVISSIFILIILISFDFIRPNNVYFPLLMYFKIYFVVVVAQLSFLSGVVTIFPLCFLLILDLFFSKRSKKEYISVS